MAEEHRCQPPQLCANNCGFFGSAATQNLCSRCYRDLQLTEQQSSSAKLALNQSLTNASALITSPSSSSEDRSSAIVDEKVEKTSVAEEKVVAVAQPNRCLTCRRRVGITGFKCRCGMTFCGSHRYPEQHACTFDFRGMGKEQIAKANPVVKGEKLERI